MDRLKFIEHNNLSNYEYFANNYEAIMTIYTICTLFKDYNIKNLSINSNTIYFEVKKSRRIPIINSSSVYDKKYQLDLNINNDTVGITMKEVEVSGQA